MTPEEEKERGARADRLLNDPLMQEAFKEVKAGIHRAFDNIESPSDDDLMRLFMMNKALEKVRGVLERYVKTGEMAIKQLTRER